MENEEYLIHELAERAGVTVRTIRYYSDEGLLPQPVVRGKYAYYTPDHLRRLELIRQMKDAYLPLREIRQMVNSMSGEELQEKLSSPAVKPDTLMKPNPPGQRAGKMELLSDADELQGDRTAKKIAEDKSSALDYIARVMGQQSDLRTTTERKLQPAQPPLFGDDRSAGEPWRRIELVPGWELHVREPLDTHRLHIVKQITDFAHKLLGTKK